MGMAEEFEVFLSHGEDRWVDVNIVSDAAC
jgi:hypothetical protein